MNKERGTTIASLQEWLTALALTLGEDTLICVRDKDGLHSPKLCFESAEKIVTIK